MDITESISKESTNNNEKKNVKALERGINILRCFDTNHRTWTQVEIRKKMQLDKATTHRFMKTLEATGFLRLDPNTGIYTLGSSVFQLSYVWLSEIEVINIALPYLKTLNKETEETSGMSLWNYGGAHVVSHIPTLHPFKQVPEVGQLFTDLSNTHCKIFLAYADNGTRKDWLSKKQEKLTPNTVTDKTEIEKILNKIREEGVAYDKEEHQLRVCAIGVPVFDFSRNVRASVAISLPVERYTDKNIKNYIQSLKKASKMISYDLGYREE